VEGLAGNVVERRLEQEHYEVRDIVGRSQWPEAKFTIRPHFF
jgi:hypothetical protein